MVKLPAKQIFGVPSLQLASAIDDHDKISRAESVHYRMASRLRELETQFDSKCSEIRSAYLAEMVEAIGEAE